LVGRRALLAGLGASALLPRAALAEDVINLDWDDLLPEDAARVPRAFQGLIQHDKTALSAAQPQSSGVRSDWNGQVVQMRGFVVPIDFDGTAVTAFILVPYVGACVHVPPPPANQLVFVTTSTPYESEGLFAPVLVTGMFGVSSISTELAQIGYALSADRIEPFRA